MLYRNAGKLPNPVSVISLGGAGIGSNSNQLFFNNPVSHKQAIETVHMALENGINLIDTSPFYGDSESKIGYALEEYQKRPSIYISTKVGRHPVFNGFDPENVLRSVESSLKNLRTNYIDILHLHDPDESEFEQIFSNGKTLEILMDLKNQGIFRYLGLGVREHDLHKAFIECGFADIILPYMDFNLLRQNLRPVLDLAGKKNIAVMLGSALCMGYLSGKNIDEINVSHFDIDKEIDIKLAQSMFDWCQKKGDTELLPAMNYLFILKNQAVGTIVVGASSSREMKKSIDYVQDFKHSSIFDEFIKEFQLTY